MSSAVMAHLLQLDRPDATPRLPATAEAVTLTPSLSHGPQQDRLAGFPLAPMTVSWPADTKLLVHGTTATRMRHPRLTRATWSIGDRGYEPRLWDWRCRLLLARRTSM